MESQTFVIIAVLILGFGLVSGRLQKSIITPPMVFVVFGMLMSGHVLGLVELDGRGELEETLAELTLILVLFTDASRINLKVLRREYYLPLRLLAIGMPLRPPLPRSSRNHRPQLPQRCRKGSSAAFRWPANAGADGTRGEGP